jgi:hypothetical protein
MAKGFEFINNTFATMEPGVYNEKKSIFCDYSRVQYKGNKRLCTRGSC